MAHGRKIFEFTSGNPKLNGLFNDIMACTSKVVTSAILSGHKEGFNSIRSWLTLEVGQEASYMRL